MSQPRKPLCQPMTQMISERSAATQSMVPRSDPPSGAYMSVGMIVAERMGFKVQSSQFKVSQSAS
jgi:hypothetical protein